MALFEVDRAKLHRFANAAAFDGWLAKRHDEETEVWIQIHKRHSGLQSISPAQAIDVALCWGWIDGIRKAFDATSFLQRYTPRRRRSTWSQINVDNVARLMAEGRMTEHGLRQVNAAKADGRWARAYKSGKEMKIPDDLQAAIDAAPKAKRMLGTLSERSRLAMALQTHNMKTQAGRSRKVAALVAMLERGEAIYPQRFR